MDISKLSQNKFILLVYFHLELRSFWSKIPSLSCASLIKQAFLSFAVLALFSPPLPAPQKKKKTDKTWGSIWGWTPWLPPGGRLQYRPIFFSSVLHPHFKSTESFFDDIEAQAKFKQLILAQWEFCVLSPGMTVTQKDTLKRYKSPLSQ